MFETGQEQRKKDEVNYLYTFRHVGCGSENGGHVNKTYLKRAGTSGGRARGEEGTNTKGTKTPFYITN